MSKFVVNSIFLETPYITLALVVAVILTYLIYKFRDKINSVLKNDSN